MNVQAEDLNTAILELSPTVSQLLSERGKAIYFPKRGILSQSADANGKKINATIGSAVEGDGTPMRLGSIANQLMIDPGIAFPYAPSPGRQDIRQKWKAMLYEKNPSLTGKILSLPVVTCALTHGLSMMGYLFADGRDTIVLSDLYWENYDLIFSNAYGSGIQTFNLYDGNKMDLNSLRTTLEKQKGGKLILVLNFPNNPSGYTPTIAEADEITRIIKAVAETGKKILVVVDDAYFGLVYEKGIITESLFTRLANLHENVLAAKLDGPTKEDYVWGLRVGFVTYGIKGGTEKLYTALEAKTAGAIRGNISNVSNLSQSLLVKAYESGTYPGEKALKFQLLKARYEAVKKVFADNVSYAEYFRPLPYNSGYFMCVRMIDKLDGEKVRQILLNTYSTGIINFGSIIRIAYSSVAVEKIPELFSNIYQACKEAIG